MSFCTRLGGVIAAVFVLAGLAGLQHAHAQNATVRGFVTDASNGEALLGVNVVLENPGGDLRGAATDSDGIYSISRLPAGRYFLRASFIGFETFVDTLRLASGERLTLNIALEEEEEELGEVIVEAAPETGAAKVTAGLQIVRPKDIELIPTPDVSGDLVTFLTTLPGVISLGDRGGQLFIRGGEPSHNMTLIDGMYVHQPYHLLGFYSAFLSNDPAPAEIYTMNVDGSDIMRVTRTPLDDFTPRWSPDGTRFAFVCEMPESDEICLITTDGGGLTRLPDNEFDDSDPLWRPLP